MPAPSTVTDDHTFIMTCLKHTTDKPKINFDEVAKELGSKSGTAWYVTTSPSSLNSTLSFQISVICGLHPPFRSF